MPETIKKVSAQQTARNSAKASNPSAYTTANLKAAANRAAARESQAVESKR